MSYVGVILADAPRHYWRCTDPGGGLLHDLGGAAQRALVVVGQPTLPYSGVASDGGSVWMDANAGAWHTSGDTVQSPMSVECWVWRHTLRAVVEVIFGHYGNLQFNGGNQVVYASGGPNVTSPAAPTEQAWHHIVGTYGPVGGAKLYIDAINVVTGAYGAAFGPFAQVPSIGMSGAGTLFASANIAECATYNVELTPAQINAHFLAADTTASRPVYRGLGTVPSVTGGTVTVAELGAEILASVRKTY